MTNKIAMIIASAKFRDEEYARPKQVFLDSGFSVTTASSSLEPSSGMLGAVVTPDTLYTSIDPIDYDAVVFVGGGGSREYFDDTAAHSLAKNTLSANRVLAAICIAPSILANAGLLQDKLAVVYGSEATNLQEKGAVLQISDIARDGNIVTATGPGAAKEFAEVIVEAIRSM